MLPMQRVSYPPLPLLSFPFSLPLLSPLPSPLSDPSSVILSPHTKCPGSKKFGTPSSTAYSCPQLPHTSFPSLTVVSSSTRCRSLAVWLGSSSLPSSPSPTPPSFATTRSSRVGAVAGSSGNPNCMSNSNQQTQTQMIEIKGRD